MTQEVIELAKQAGIEDWWDQEIIDREGLQKHLEAFAKLVAAKEREACEKLRDHEDVLAPVGNSAWSEMYQDGWIAGTQAYHEAIRARSKQ